MRKGLILLLLLSCYTMSFARHIKGGWIQYEYLGTGAGTGSSVYRITVYLFVSCTTTGPTDEVVLGVFDGASYSSVMSQTIPKTAENTATKTSFNSCISDPPAICYMVYTYVTSVQLSDNPNGYFLTVQDAFRINDIINITGSGSDGITITAIIPGTTGGVDYHTNTSPFFIFKDTAVICYSSTFNYQFEATDIDGDSLSYSFGNGLNVTGANMNTSSQQPANPPYPSVTYTSGYSGTTPLGSDVTINPVTGLISGIAPAITGPYVVAVYVQEWRKGVLLNTTKKELQINVANCSLTAASLKPAYINCDSYTFNFQNESISSNVTSYRWNFGVPNSNTDTSSQPTPEYTYADTGVYTLKLSVSNTGGCTDTASSTIKVYPGFTPDFTVNGSCYQSPFLFNDVSYIKYGALSSRTWNFGDQSAITDTSSVQSPSWQYASPGNVTVTFVINSTKGCSGIVSKTVVVNDKPAIFLPFTDTLICSNDTLPLIVNSSGTIFSWGPAYNIINSTSTNPIVYPFDTTIYTVVVRDKGCVDSATVKVNVLQYITVSLIPDTAICKTDSITLQPVSYALSYLWSESGEGGTLNAKTIKYPKAAPPANTIYYVKANLGHCQDSAQTTVNVSPYPIAMVGADTGICYGKSVRLQASTTAAYYSWSPATSLYQANTLTPLAGPQQTTDYLFMVKDTFYCTKTVTDTIRVTVTQPIRVDAGKDTAVVVNQPLQLQATASDGSAHFVWSPATYVSNAFVYNPVVTVTSATVDSVTYLVTAVTPGGCFNSDAVTVRVYKTLPDIFIPTAFTPNGDNVNDVERPILVGISQFDFFKIFNRWGQLVFQTSQAGAGWNGYLNGVKQSSGTYVFMARGKDYLGNVILRQGTVVLIR